MCTYTCAYTPALARVSVCEPAYRFIRGDVETVGGTQIGRGREGARASTHSDLHVCPIVYIRVRVRVDVCQRLLRPSVAFPCLNARRLNAKAFQIDVEARRFETEEMDKGKTDNPRCNSW